MGMSHGKPGSRAPRAQRSQPHGSYRCAKQLGRFAATDEEQRIRQGTSRRAGDHANEEESSGRDFETATAGLFCCSMTTETGSV